MKQREKKRKKMKKNCRKSYHNQYDVRDSKCNMMFYKDLHKNLEEYVHLKFEQILFWST